MVDEVTGPVLHPNMQAAVAAAPTYFADGLLGTSNSGGVARLTLGSFVFDVTPGATFPALRPVVTLMMVEAQLVVLAQEILRRAETMGIEIKPLAPASGVSVK